MLGMVAVRKVEPHDVDSGVDQPRQPLGLARGGPDGGDDLGPPHLLRIAEAWRRPFDGAASWFGGPVRRLRSVRWVSRSGVSMMPANFFDWPLTTFESDIRLRETRSLQTDA